MQRSGEPPHNTNHDRVNGPSLVNAAPEINITSPVMEGTPLSPVNASNNTPPAAVTAPNSPSRMDVMCGPLLNYKGMGTAEAGALTWRGSVLVVAAPGPSQPRLHLRCEGGMGRVKATHQQSVSRGNNDTQQTNGPSHTPLDGGMGSDSADSNASTRTVMATKLYSDPAKSFWQFALDVHLQPYEAKWVYTIPEAHSAHDEASPDISRAFYVPSLHQSMRIMFHSCNGFSVGTDEEAWSGPALWNDVVRVHDERPFHCMIGGGDQIYNDGVRVEGPLKSWTSIANPKKRRDFPFHEDLRADCDKYYFDRYVTWYNTGAFATANGRIPQINIWDDHDIIDGFGSYTDNFMRCNVFRGIGGVAFKYYLLFQHHAPPPASTFTSDVPATMKSQGPHGAGPDPRQLKDTYVMPEGPEDPSWIIGDRPGPYVAERSRSLYMRLGKRMAFVGIDARTERTRHQINYPDTYDLIFRRLNAELAACNGEIKHLILLLGIPIAYPRLIWLENILTSPIIGPIRFLNKRFGFAGDFFNQFDGQVDLLDDLDDHYTARQHKKERKDLMLRLQRVAEQHHVRVTILGGDVHLAALGRFYSNPKLNLASENDHRYMVNVISSAITNHPPPKAVANMLAARNKIHHLDKQTDETLLHMFDKEPGAEEMMMRRNFCTMPRRNYATITESATFNPGDMPANGASNGHANGGAGKHAEDFPAETCTGQNGHKPLHRGEQGAGSTHPSASQTDPSNTFGPYGLDVSIKVEINHSNRQGHTEGYGVSIPPLTKPKGVTL